jgi:hypothetical protein
MTKDFSSEKIQRDSRALDVGVAKGSEYHSCSFLQTGGRRDASIQAWEQKSCTEKS